MLDLCLLEFRDLEETYLSEIFLKYEAFKKCIQVFLYQEEVQNDYLIQTLVF